MDQPFSPDGRHLLTTRNVDAAHTIRLFGLDPIESIGFAVAGLQGTWSPNGDFVAFVRQREDGRTQGLYLLDMLGNERTLVDLFDQQHLRPSSPHWSPDGTKIAYTIFNTETRQSTIHRFDIIQNDSVEIAEGQAMGWVINFF